MGRTSKDNSGPAKNSHIPHRKPVYCLALGLLAAWYMCPGLNGKSMRVQEVAGVSGSHHTRFTLSWWRNQALPHHVSAFLNLSCANQRSPSSMGIKIPPTWLRNPRVRRVFRSWTPPEAGFCLACHDGARVGSDRSPVSLTAQPHPDPPPSAPGSLYAVRVRCQRDSVVFPPHWDLGHSSPSTHDLQSVSHNTLEKQKRQGRVLNLFYLKRNTLLRAADK